MVALEAQACQLWNVVSNQRLFLIQLIGRKV